ncbi:MAG: hypothetical protein WBC19_10280 [Pyrinomonadaceae bacterium]|nr:hypothetical protein [Chloracidobacterium sp.]MBP7415334.1 hypothetical protein [Pyrinomonadaceae bacterium]
MKFRSWTIIVFALVVFATTESASAQTATITEEDYWKGIKQGHTATRAVFPRRETRKYESVSDGNVTYSRTEISEYLSSDTYRNTKTVVRNGTTNVTEALQIGRVRYCRENAMDWKTSGCYQNPPAPLDDADETKYALETTKDSLTYLRTTTFEEKATEKKAATNFATEDRFVLNKDMSIRERTIIKMLALTKSVTVRETDKYEYGIPLKPIVAPIK